MIIVKRDINLPVDYISEDNDLKDVWHEMIHLLWNPVEEGMDLLDMIWGTGVTSHVSWIGSVR